MHLTIGTTPEYSSIKVRLMAYTSRILFGCSRALRSGYNAKTDTQKFCRCIYATELLITGCNWISHRALRTSRNINQHTSVQFCITCSRRCVTSSVRAAGHGALCATHTTTFGGSISAIWMPPIADVGSFSGIFRDFWFMG